MSAPVEATRPLHVGYVLKKYPRLSETFIVNEILGVEGEGAAVSIFSLRQPDDGRFHSNLAEVQGQVTYLPLFKAQTMYGALETLASLGDGGRDALPRALAFLKRLPAGVRPQLLMQALHIAGAVRERGIDHLHAHFMTIAARASYLVHLFTGVPYSVTAHAKDIYRHTVDKEVFREVAGAARALVTVCDANAQWIRDELLQGAPANLVRIYNGIPRDFRAVKGEQRQANLILAVGRLVEKKGFHLLLEACRLLADEGVDFECLLIGDGDEREALEQAARRLDLAGRVRIPGPLPREDVMRWMSRARVLAAPCVQGDDGNKDALPTVLIEALAAGLPSVSTPVSGIPEIIADDEEGFIVPERDVPALAVALKRCMTDDALWQRLSAACPRKVEERFDRRRTVPRLVSHFGRAGDGARASQAAD